MKVAFHAGQLLQPVPGGIGRYEIALLRHLGSFGVETIAFGAGPRPAAVPRPVPWIDLGAPRGSVRYELWHRLRRPRLRVDADLVHAPSLAVPPVSDLPLAVTVHDIAFLRMPETTTPRGIAFHTRALEVARRDATLVIVPSEFTRSELEREGFDPDRIEVAPFGVDAPEEREVGDIDAAIALAGVRDPYVLSVGTIEPRKDFATVAAAVERLRASHPGLTLVVCGPRGWGEVEGLDHPFVRVLGAQPWNVLDALYRRAAVTCLASVYEGFGLPAVESMARGTPVVTTTGSSLEELAQGGAGLLFAPRDVDACVAQLDTVLSDRAVREELQRAGLARAAALNWPRCAEQHAAAFAHAVARAAP
jgi:glycosyltransferase involved in cell wall biosynthesis